MTQFAMIWRIGKTIRNDMELRDKHHVAREHGLQPKRHGSSVPVRIGRPGIRVTVKKKSNGSGSTQSISKNRCGHACVCAEAAPHMAGVLSASARRCGDAYQPRAPREATPACRAGMLAAAAAGTRLSSLSMPA
jgi:hypothetical protein